MTDDATISDTLLPTGSIPREEVYAFILTAETGQPFKREIIEAYIEEIVRGGMVAHLPTWGHWIKGFLYPDDTPDIMFPPKRPN